MPIMVPDPITGVIRNPTEAELDAMREVRIAHARAQYPAATLCRIRVEEDVYDADLSYLDEGENPDDYISFGIVAELGTVTQNDHGACSCSECEHVAWEVVESCWGYDFSREELHPAEGTYNTYGAFVCGMSNDGGQFVSEEYSEAIADEFTYWFEVAERNARDASTNA